MRRRSAIKTNGWFVQRQSSHGPIRIGRPHVQLRQYPFSRTRIVAVRKATSETSLRAITSPFMNEPDDVASDISIRPDDAARKHLETRFLPNQIITVTDPFPAHL
jgi:hypothetical protein